MISKSITAFFLLLFAVLGLSFLLVPIFAIFFLLHFNLDLILIKKNAIIYTILFTSVLILTFAYLFQFLTFYIQFFLKKRLQFFIPYQSTKYKAMLDLVIQDIESKIKLPPNWLKIYSNEDYSKFQIFSFGSSKNGVIFFSGGMLEKLLISAKEDSSQALTAIENLITHEISHLLNLDYITADFYKINLKVLTFFETFYFILFFIFEKINTFIPLWKSVFKFIFSPIISAFNFIFRIPAITLRQVFWFFRRTILQTNETLADERSVMVTGIKGLKANFDIFGNYSSIFSLHCKTIEKKEQLYIRIQTAKEKLNFDDGENEVNVTYYIMILIFISVIFYLIFIGADFKNLYLQIQASEKFENIKIFHTIKFYLTALKSLVY